MFELTPMDRDSVIIALHGGPTPNLFPGSFTFFNNLVNYSLVEMLKYEMMYPDVLTPFGCTFEEGITYVDTTAAMIEKVVQHYKKQDKFVVLMGHSWGALVLGEYLDDYGTESVDKLVIMNGRIQVQQQFVDDLLRGAFPLFRKDGTTIYYDEPVGTYPQGMMNLGAGAFYNRWADSLDGINLDKMMYVHAGDDEQTGALIDVELDFLTNSRSSSIYIPIGGHGASFDVSFSMEILEFIRSTVSSVEIAAKNDSESYSINANAESISIESKIATSANLYDINGKSISALILQRGFTSFEIADYPNGIYFLSILDDNELLGTEKIVVRK
ncbi:MAG: hypothetical protein Kapaf2KO_05270 [Candidatus Kapaibacteriales bacterium]